METRIGNKRWEPAIRNQGNATGEGLPNRSGRVESMETLEFLEVRNGKIVGARSGREIRLRGTNIGGWLNMEATRARTRPSATR